jgi:hypothetical protein
MSLAIRGPERQFVAGVTGKPTSLPPTAGAALIDEWSTRGGKIVLKDF